MCAPSELTCCSSIALDWGWKRTLQWLPFLRREWAVVDLHRPSQSLFLAAAAAVVIVLLSEEWKKGSIGMVAIK